MNSLRKQIAWSGCWITVLALLLATSAWAASAPSNPDPWPREITLSNARVLVYQPQIDKWEGNRLDFRAAVAAKASGSNEETFGVIWGSARTDVDRVARMVTLEDLSLTRSRFPTLADNGASYLGELRQHLPTGVRTIALDRLEASLAASGNVRPGGVPLKNDAPRIIVSYTPAILIPIAGDPVLREVDSEFSRVLNTRALILQDWKNSYLHLYDGWMKASAIDGPWQPAEWTPVGIDRVAEDLAKSGQVDLLDGGNVQPKPSLKNGAPTVHVSHTPTELIAFTGQPDLQPIRGTALLWATNTTADVIVNTADNNYYILISGRWYRAQSLSGPWSFVASTSLPAAFRGIPPNAPAGRVLASVAGTAQAQEALIENSIPHSATVPRANGPTFSPVLDGAPQFRPINGTPLRYIVNSPDPIIQVDAHTYYALRNGVWFAATSATGPWVVATSVPAVIYTIPPSSPIYYVTYVQIYGATADVVYVGYTPGYMGTVVAADGVVVYGTGYTYEPWVGTVYYPPPVTYGVAAYPAYDPAADMMFGFAFGAATEAMLAPAWGPMYYGPTATASENVYGHWGNTVVSGTRTYGYNTATGNVGVTGSYTATNQRTGTTSNIQTARGYNAYTGTEGAGYQRTYSNPTTGASASVERGAAYNPYTGQAAKGSEGSFSNPTTGVSGSGERSATYDAQTGVATKSAEGTVTDSKSGSSATGQRETATSASGQRASESSGTVTDQRTGQTESYKTASAGNDHYADVNGNVYRNTGSGWQKNTGSGWESARPEESSSAEREQQARTSGENRVNSFHGGGGGGFGGFRGGRR